MNKTSFDLILCDDKKTARKAGKGGFWYERDESGEITSLFVFLPYTDCDKREYTVKFECTINRENASGVKWSLSGDESAPTLKPAIKWKHVWCGTIIDGKAVSF